MRIYLDDDSAAPLLARLLRQAGHDVQFPADVGLSGEDDVVHLTHAVKDDRALCQMRSVWQSRWAVGSEAVTKRLKRHTGKYP